MEKRLLSFTRRLFLRVGAITGALMLLFTVNNARAQTYCVPVFQNTGGAWGMGMRQFTMGPISHTFGSLDPVVDMYTDRTSSYFTAYAPGAIASFNWLSGMTNPTQMNIFVDWNRDGIWNTTNEMVYVSGTGLSTNANVNGSFQVPPGQAPGSYRVRAISDYALTGTTINNPCLVQYACNALDFTLIVTSPALDIMAIDVFPKLALGNNNLTIRVLNTTTGTTINSYDIGYRIGNGTATTQNVTGRSLTSGSVEDMAFSTPLNIASSGVYELKAWVRNPNGSGVGNATNDTVYRTYELCAALSGTYTINAAGGTTATNFTSFNAAVQKLITCGVSGPVVFNVAPGTYTEQIEIPFIDGVSPTNTITFDGGNRNTTIIQFNATTQANAHVVRLGTGASHIEFRNLSILATGSTYGWPVQIKSNVQYCRFANNLIRTWDWSTNTSSTWFIPVVFSDNNTSYSSGFQNVNHVYLDSNIIRGGYFNVTVYYGNNNSFNIKVRNNIMDGWYYYGMYGYAAEVHFENNQLWQRQSTTTGGYGYYFTSTSLSGSNHMRIIGNEVHRAFQYGFYLNSVTNNGTRGIIANNIAGPGLINATSYTFYMSSSSNWDFWHNTLDCPSTGTGVNTSALYMTSCQNVDVRNNIFSISTAGATGVPVRVPTMSTTTFDFNNYYKEGAGTSLPIFISGTTEVNADNLRTSLGMNQNSVSQKPAYISLSNLRMSPSEPSPFGSAGLLTTDIDGNSRCNGFPTVGADESGYASSTIVDIFTDDTIYVNTPTRFYNSATDGEAKSHVWDIDNGTATYTDLHITHTFTQTGNYTVELQTTTCDGVFTATKNIQVVNPTSPPVSAFLSVSNKVDQGYPIGFIDQSTGGPSAWSWSTVPATGVSFVNGNNVQNPSMVFTNPGTYEICLTASNSAGQGNQACKVAYIEVTEATNLCGSRTLSRTAEGKIFDQGGRFNDYSNNSNCSFLIDPCASEVTLAFHSFNLDAGDVLRIFDGADATGKPLHVGSGFTGNIVPGDLVAATGKMFVQFQSNASGTRPGFEASWTSKPKQFTAPIAAFRAPDTLYTGTNFTFVSNSTGTDATLRWDFNNDGIWDAFGELASYTFSAPGNYFVRLEIEDCGGIDGSTRSILVLDPTSAPVPDFVSDVRVISPGQTVSFYDRSTQAPTNWEWIITPATYAFVGGTDQFSQNPQIRFNAIGSYTIELQASNAFGTGSTIKTNAIRVVQYCYPGAGLNSDLGITRVTFAGIDNVSQVGPVTYSDFTASVKPAAVQKGTRYPITILRNTNNEEMSRNVWIDFDGDGVFGTNELVASHVADKSLSWTDTILIPSTLDEGTTRMRIGTSYGITNNSACGVNPYGEFEDYTIAVFSNLTRPVITLIGAEVVSLEVGTSYTDSGATAMDDVDGNLTSQMVASTNLDINTVGTYFYRYNVSDLNGNSAEATRIIHVTPDVTAPSITLRGANPFNVVLGTLFIDPGVDAVDSYDGVLPPSAIQTVGLVNSAQVGQYTITYTATDNAGNSASVQRIVNVGDTTAPIIVLRDANVITIPLGANFVDPGAVVIDDNGFNLPYFVDYTVINNMVVGDYDLTYTAQDPSGNQAIPVIRTIQVRDLTAPVLTLIGDTVIIEVNTNFSDPGYLVSDNYDLSVPVTVTGSVDNTKTGVYVLFYEATDAGGNSSPTLVRIVNVVDTKAPVISINGDQFMTICRWSDYQDAGVVVTDNYDTNIELEIFDEVNSEWEGLYSVRYVARDKSGNRASAERLVRVVACATGTEDINASVVKVFPNPSKGAFVVTTTEAGFEVSDIKVMDALGKQVTFQSTGMQEGIQLDLTSQPAGIYFIHVSINGNWSAHKVQIIK